jgi:hypothetical protein
MIRIISLSLVLVSLSTGLPKSQGEIPIRDQVALLIRVLSSDKNYDEEKKDFVIAVLYEHRLPGSDSVQSLIMSLQDSVGTMLVDGIAVRFFPVVLDEAGNWKDAVLRQEVEAVIITQVEKLYIPSISEFCRSQNILSMTTEAEYVEEGVSVGIGSSEGKPVILVNLPVSINEGAKFSSRVLQIAKIFR